MHLSSPYGRLLVLDFSRIYNLGSLEIQEPRTKLWLIDTLITPTPLSGVETWVPHLKKLNNWKEF